MCARRVSSAAGPTHASRVAIERQKQLRDGRRTGRGRDEGATDALLSLIHPPSIPACTGPPLPAPVPTWLDRMDATPPQLAIRSRVTIPISDVTRPRGQRVQRCRVRRDRSQWAEPGGPRKRDRAASRQAGPKARPMRRGACTSEKRHRHSLFTGSPPSGAYGVHTTVSRCDSEAEDNSRQRMGWRGASGAARSGSR